MSVCERILYAAGGPRINSGRSCVPRTLQIASQSTTLPGIIRDHLSLPPSSNLEFAILWSHPMIRRNGGSAVGGVVRTNDIIVTQSFPFADVVYRKEKVNRRRQEQHRDKRDHNGSIYTYLWRISSVPWFFVSISENKYRSCSFVFGWTCSHISGTVSYSFSVRTVVHWVLLPMIFLLFHGRVTTLSKLFVDYFMQGKSLFWIVDLTWKKWFAWHKKTPA